MQPLVPTFQAAHFEREPLDHDSDGSTTGSDGARDSVQPVNGLPLQQAPASKSSAKGGSSSSSSSSARGSAKKKPAAKPSLSSRRKIKWNVEPYLSKMKKAIAVALSGRSTSKVAAQFGIPARTLRRYVANERVGVFPENGSGDEASTPPGSGRSSPVLAKEQSPAQPGTDFSGKSPGQDVFAKHPAGDNSIFNGAPAVLQRPGHMFGGAAGSNVQGVQTLFATKREISPEAHSPQLTPPPHGRPISNSFSNTPPQPRLFAPNSPRFVVVRGDKCHRAPHDVDSRAFFCCCVLFALPGRCPRRQLWTTRMPCCSALPRQAHEHASVRTAA